MQPQLETSISATALATPRPSVPTATAVSDGDRFIREDECFRLTGLSRTTRWRLERRGEFPQRRQLSDNAIGWSLSEVCAWRASRPMANVAA